MNSFVEYMVSYQLFSSLCGNQCFDTMEEAEKYIKENKHLWKSADLNWFSTKKPVSDVEFVRKIV